MAIIKLGGLYSDNTEVVVDDKNLDKLINACKWHYDLTARCAVGTVEGKIVKMQRYIMNVYDRRTIVLFRDGNNMNCKEENQEVVSRRDYQRKTMETRKDNGTLITRGEAEERVIKERTYENVDKEDWNW